MKMSIYNEVMMIKYGRVALYTYMHTGRSRKANAKNPDGSTVIVNRFIIQIPGAFAFSGPSGIRVKHPSYRSNIKID
jgi:hypothetical protein